ncbi:MAG: hypothetical protein ACKOTA_07215, partial [Solirubrobacterales bacterium]
MSRLDALLASGRVPDPALRAGARAQSRLRLLRERRLAARQDDPLGAAALRRSRGPIAVATQEANHQHYAVAPGLQVALDLLQERLPVAGVLEHLDRDDAVEPPLQL